MYFPSSLLILWGYQRFQLGDIRPLAYNSVFNQMSEAILVLDQNSHLVDYNPSAEGLLDISAHISLGQILDPQKLHLNNFRIIKTALVNPVCAMK
jgi:PAS domain-containing protein